MQFLVKAYDGEGMLEKRMEVRPRHLEAAIQAFINSIQSFTKEQLFDLCVQLK